MSEEGQLKDFAMKGKWRDVVGMYSRDSRAHGMRINKSKDTALHLAALDNQEEIVEELIRHIRRFNTQNVLKLENERKNTPLHFAASLGSVRMCEDIASVDPSLVDIRNDDGETPLFRAALHDHKNAFLYLYTLCKSDNSRNRTNLRRNGGDSVLHAAIRNEYFDLAFQIINQLNGECAIATWVNDRGFTPLHLLASKPTAFKSGTPLELWKRIIYHCTFIEQLKREPAATSTSCQPSLKMKSQHPKNNASFPRNYKTCMDFFDLLWKGFLVVSNLKKAWNGTKMDGAEEAADREIDEVREYHSCHSSEGAVTLWPTPHIISPENNLKNEIFPENYETCINFFKVLSKAILIIVGFGSAEIRKIREKKEKHTWAVLVMNKLLEVDKDYTYGDDGSSSIDTKLKSEDTNETWPYGFDKMRVSFRNVEGDQTHQNHHEDADHEKETREKNKLKETALLIAAKNGVVEMVDQILQQFPEAIHDMNSDYKNVVHLAAENRQPDVYTLLLSKKLKNESVILDVDHQGNNALHLAANLPAQKAWRIPGDALQMHWELKWYQYVKSKMPLHSYARYNNVEKTPKMIFQETHEDLAKNGGQWLYATSQSCSLVATLVASVAFATSATIPGSHLQNKGIPVLLDRPAFMVFSISSFVALFLSVMSVLTFLSILTSRFQDRDFKWRLPWKLVMGFSSLFLSIVAMLVSYCAGHFFMLNPFLQNVALEMYIVVSMLVVLIFGIASFPLYFDLLLTIIKKVPQRSSKVIIAD